MVVEGGGGWWRVVEERKSVHLLSRFQELSRIEYKVAGGEESNVCAHKLTKVYLIHPNGKTIAIGNLERCAMKCAFRRKVMWRWTCT